MICVVASSDNWKYVNTVMYELIFSQFPAVVYNALHYSSGEATFFLIDSRLANRGRLWRLHLNPANPITDLILAKECP